MNSASCESSFNNLRYYLSLISEFLTKFCRSQPLKDQIAAGKWLEALCWTKTAETRYLLHPYLDWFQLAQSEVLHLWSIAGVETEARLPEWKQVSSEKSECLIKRPASGSTHFYKTLGGRTSAPRQNSWLNSEVLTRVFRRKSSLIRHEVQFPLAVFTVSAGICLCTGKKKSSSLTIK